MKNKFGVSWQVVATLLPELISAPDAGNARKVFAAMMQMKKLDMETLHRVTG